MSATASAHVSRETNTGDREGEWFRILNSSHVSRETRREPRRRERDDPLSMFGRVSRETAVIRVMTPSRRTPLAPRVQTPLGSRKPPVAMSADQTRVSGSQPIEPPAACITIQVDRDLGGRGDPLPSPGAPV